MSKEKNIQIIANIVKRAEAMDLLMFDKMSLMMDLNCCMTLFDLRLEDFLNADDFNFSHDIIGIQKNLNRETKNMDNFFLPRFANPHK